MRRITLPLTAILGVVLTASTVRAQQSNPSGTELVDKSGSSDSAASGNATRKPIGDPVYGMSSTRGSRYLLRNGLDYLNYKEYERALKFLREAETRKNELNDAEKLVLKRGIESAQRGLRQAADEDSPYALSDQSRNRNGFRPAATETRLAGPTDRSRAPAQKSMVNRSTPSIVTTHDADDQEESIRLASGKAVSSDSNSHNPVAARANQTDQDNPSDRLKCFLEVPKLPNLSQGLSGADIPTSKLDGFANPSLNRLLSRRHEDQLVLAPVPREDASASPSSSSAPATVSQTMPVPTTNGLAQPSTVDPRPRETTNLTVVDLETVPLSPPAPKAVQSGAPSSSAHGETDDGTLVSMPDPAVGVALAPTVSSHSTPSSTGTADDLPPLPTNLDTPAEIANAPKQPSPSVAAPPTATTATSAAIDELPLLPADLSNCSGQPRSTLDLAPSTTNTPDTPAAAFGATDDLPPLPGDLSNTAMQLGSFSHSSPVQGAAHDSSVAPPGAATDPSLPDSSSHKEEEVTLPLLPGHDETPAANASALTPAAALVSTGQPLAVVSGEAAQPKLSLAASAESINVPSNPPSVAANPEQVQEPVTPASDSIAESHNASSLPLAIETPALLPSRSNSVVPSRPNPTSTLRPELKREVEMIVRKQDDDLRRKQQSPGQPMTHARDMIVSDLRAQTQLDISRAPSPAEARPIKAIPVPEDWVPLPPRTWAAQRKYWAAAATCHLPLYFQDPVLERYGHSVEQFVGPIGRFLTYPVDDPTQSSQRNQILQPFFSAGLFGLQIAALPYNVIVDPPWEAQYDLGYYRPGDLIPTDTYWLPLHGYGPLLRGSNY